MVLNFNIYTQLLTAVDAAWLRESALHFMYPETITFSTPASHCFIASLLGGDEETESNSTQATLIEATHILHTQHLVTLKHTCSSS